jgi:hypothetical protein
MGADGWGQIIEAEQRARQREQAERLARLQEAKEKRDRELARQQELDKRRREVQCVTSLVVR